MPYLDSHYTEEQFRNLFQKLLQMELKLDELISLQAQEHPIIDSLLLNFEELGNINDVKILWSERRMNSSYAFLRLQ